MEKHPYELVIEDYYEKYKDDINKYDVFEFEDASIEGETLNKYNILPHTAYSFYVPRVTYHKSDFPTDYIKYKNKIFFLIGENIQNINNRPFNEVIECLDSLNMLDSTTVKIELGLLKPEEAKYRKTVKFNNLEAVFYIMCKDKPHKIKKRIRSSTYLFFDTKRFQNVCD